MLELHLINVGAAWSDSFERHRFDRAKLSDVGFELRQLLARDVRRSPDSSARISAAPSAARRCCGAPQLPILAPAFDP